MKFLFSRKQDISDAFQKAHEAEQEAREFAAQGWLPYIYCLPPDVEVQFIRRHSNEPFIARRSSFHPEFNVGDLYWRPLGPIVDITP